MEVIKQHRCHGGLVTFYRHASRVTHTPMEFSAFVPDSVSAEKAAPALVWLSGLTCTPENFTTKAAYQQMAAELGLVVIAPDTSPRGAGIPGEDERYDLGSGAGFYVNATREPWQRHYQMFDYVVTELVDLCVDALPVDRSRLGISGHSMGGHGALVIGLRRPDLFRSLSAFAPICNPSACPWGEVAFTTYLGDDRAAWREYDACAIIQQRGFDGEILVDQGLADEFLAGQLMPDRLEAAAAEAGVQLRLRRQPGYDHSYYFVQSFIGEHLRFHADQLARDR